MKICFFDIDGTLITTGGSGGRAMMRTIADEFELEPPVGRIRFGGRTDTAIVGDVFDAVGLARNEENLTRFRTCYLRYLDEELESCDGHVYDGVMQSLATVSAAGHIQVGLLTGNMEAAAWKKMARFELDKFFTFGGFGDRQAERDDVAREARATAVERFGDAIEEFIVIGDTPADVQCGRAIGATTIAVETGSGSPEQLAEAKPDLLVQNLTEASEFFSSL